MSTFAIVLGVAFVVGTLVFSDTLSRSFTALMASTVGDVVVRPVGAARRVGALRPAPSMPALVDELEGVEGAARVDGNVTAFGVYVVGRGRQGGRRPGPARRSARNWTDAPAGHDLEGHGDHRRPRAGEGRTRCCSTPGTAGEARLRPSARRSTSSPPREPAVLAPDAGRHRRLPRGGLAQRRDLRRLRHPRRPRSCSSTGEDAFTDIWVTAEPTATSQEELAASVDRAAARRRGGGDRRRGGRRGRQRDLRRRSASSPPSC